MTSALNTRFDYTQKDLKDISLFIYERALVANYGNINNQITHIVKKLSSRYEISAEIAEERISAAFTSSNLSRQMVLETIQALIREKFPEGLIESRKSKF